MQRRWGGWPVSCARSRGRSDNVRLEQPDPGGGLAASLAGSPSGWWRITPGVEAVYLSTANH